MVDESEGLSDPGLGVASVLQGHPRLLLEGLFPILDRKAHLGDYSQSWVRTALVARNALRDALEEGGLSEPWVLHALPKALPEGTTLFVGNSMPMRDVDSFFFSMPKRLRFLANRGASGIDGVVSSALGAAAALDMPIVLVVGDLSFYHDMNGLLAAKRHGLRATIVLLNNNGGGIFSFLPQAKEAKAFEELFGTPLGLNFGHVASLYGLTYHKALSREDFLSFLRESLKAPGVSLLEVPSDRQENVTIHQRLFLAVKNALEENQT
jgi:2-succinyl-5-enolpyruvyl-6-hydroxy-3-cyclohexene-1-carboxylate synthase